MALGYTALERLLADWLPPPTKAEVEATYTHHSHARRYRSREAPLKFALQRITDDGAQRPVMQQWLQRIEQACPGSLYLPQFEAGDILRVLGCARGAPNCRTRSEIVASAMRRQMEDLALHELSWDDIMAVLLRAEPLVLRIVVDDRPGVAQRAVQSKKRARDVADQLPTYSSTEPILLQPNPFQWRLLALAVRRFRQRLTSCRAKASAGAGAGRVLPIMVSITWYNPQRRKFHAHMCALSIEQAAATAASAEEVALPADTCTGMPVNQVERQGGLVAILYDPIPRGMQAEKAEHARSEIVALLRQILEQQCGGVRLLLSGAFQPQKVDPTKSPLCAPFSLMFLHARALGLSDEDYNQVFATIKRREGLGLSLPHSLLCCDGEHANAECFQCE
jgi:hypothetical protein